MDEMDDSNEMKNLSSPDFSDDELESMEIRCKEIEFQLLDNKYMYDLHTELVALYEKLADFDSLKAAYLRFHECFPLTPKIWLTWIKNEIKVAVSDQEKQYIVKLFDLAVEDYLSIELWQAYAEYAMEIGSLEKSREVLEKALNNAGLHTKDASLLWDYLREIELANLSMAPKETDSWKVQAARVIKTFQRQLAVPLIGMENTYGEWQEWKGTLPSDFTFDPEPIEWGYKKALKDLELYKPFEEELLSTQDESQIFEIYKRYILVVKDPPTIICLYERAVSQLSLNPALWLDYCKYVYKLGDIALKISERSLRNCTWSEELWIMKLRILENLNRNESEVMSSFEQGLTDIAPSPGLQLWFAYIEYIKRNSKNEEKLNKLLEQATFICEGFDPHYSFGRFHARLLAKKDNIKEAMSIWNNILSVPQNKGNLTFWLEFLALIKQYGNTNQIRSLYQRALNSCKDWAYYIAEEWLLFEREYGTLSSIIECNEKCKNVKSNHEQATQQQYNQQENHHDEDTKRGKKRKPHQEPIRDSKKPKPDVERMMKEPRKPIEKDPTKTVFVSNLDPKVDEESLKAIFPNAFNIEICLDRKGKSKCFGYIQFSHEEEVMTALARDREPLNGRPIFISNCKPDKNERKPVFKYSTEIEENKLFVRGLPKTLSKDEVMEIFKPYGAIDTRIVLHKNGQSKGLAYIEFPNPESTKKALTAVDQMKIGENVISVAISAPPPKKAIDEKPSEPTRNSRSRLQVPLIPRSVQVKSDPSSTETKIVQTPKSNDDFRRMLLNK
ncbi:squamous cell carcinoma antigen recognized by T-cells 3 [Coccinella septempunctata]|uniref:squamous cell carcinoma antigen recognized by T-cells 3 n=1 Tax=Coccinella septempunctata TaxID=41139 RepID=UPI001D06740E|nr:squamous cell carcinoma antigen recognized by T-cells 3 [Coccinella septempunctata]